MKISLRDPLWQFIAVIVGIIAIATAIIIYYSQRQYKELSYETISSSPLLTKTKEIEGNVQILFDNKPVNNVYLIILKLINSGNTSISAKDFESPLIFSFSEHTNILLADVIKTEPDGLKLNLNNMKNKLIVEPTLLNVNDTITFKFLLSDFAGDIKPEARIYGIKNILKIKAKGYVWFGIIIGLLGGAIFSITSIIIFAKFSKITIKFAWPKLKKS